jgi:hypothetical protein
MKQSLAMPHQTTGKSIQVDVVLGNMFSSTEHFICAEQNTGEPKLLSMALKIPMPECHRTHHTQLVNASTLYGLS